MTAAWVPRRLAITSSTTSASSRRIPVISMWMRSESAPPLPRHRHRRRRPLENVTSSTVSNPSTHTHAHTVTCIPLHTHTQTHTLIHLDRKAVGVHLSGSNGLG